MSVDRILPSTLSTASASQPADFWSCISTACFPAAYTSHSPVTRRMATLAPGLLALAGRDLNPLDSIRNFHRLIFGSSSSKLSRRDDKCRRRQALLSALRREAEGCSYLAA